MQHLDDHQLQSWLDLDRSGISRAEAAEVEDHVERCEVCAARLAELEATSTRTRSLLAAAAPAAQGAPDFGEVVRRSRRNAPSGRGGRWWMTAGWAASLVVATGVGWLAHDQLRFGADAGPPTAANGGEMVVAAATEDADADVSAPDEEPTAAPPPTTTPSTAAEAGVSAEQARAMVPPPDTGATGDPGAAADPEPEITIAPTTFADVEAPAELPTDPGSLRVQGQVRAEDGSPLAGAQIMAQGSTLATLTGSDGTFSLLIPADAPTADSARPLTLTAQILGYRSATVDLDPRVADTALVDFRLEGVALRQEVVVTGRAPEAQAAPEARVVGEFAGHPLEVWTPVTRALAESQADFAVLIVPELAVVEIELGELRGAVAVRVRQVLDSGATLTLVQQRAEDPPGEPTLPADQPAETVERQGVRIIGSAPIAVDSLRVLLNRAR